MLKSQQPLLPLNSFGPSNDAEKALLDEVSKDVFDYHPWTEEQKTQGAIVREALRLAFVAVITNVPPCPDRSTALRKIREARMDANSAITHSGKY